MIECKVASTIFYKVQCLAIKYHPSLFRWCLEILKYEENWKLMMKTWGLVLCMELSLQNDTPISKQFTESLYINVLILTHKYNGVKNTKLVRMLGVILDKHACKFIPGK